MGRFDGTVDQSIIENLRAPGAFAWVIQEKAKGDKLRLLFNQIKAGSDYAGWGFNLTDPLIETDPVFYKLQQLTGGGYTIYERVPKLAAEIGPVTTALLDSVKRASLFDTGWGVDNSGTIDGIGRNVNTTARNGPPWIMDLFDPSAGDAIADDPVKHTQLLNEAIPALSLALGANRSERLPLTLNRNMPDVFADSAGWPRPIDGVTGLPRWHHSDIREVAYLYLRGFYDELSSIANQ